MRGITLYRPRVDSLAEAHQRIAERMFGYDPFVRFLDLFWDADKEYRTPVTDMETLEDKYLLKMEVPGFGKDDIAMEVTEGVLEVRVRKETEEKDEKKGIFSKTSRSFYQAFRLPEDVDLENIAATYESGVLRLTIPRIEVSEPATRIIEVT